MKKFFTIIAFAAVALCNAFGANAQDEVTLLTVNLKNGNVEQFNLPDKPVVTFEDGKMLVKSGEMSGEYVFAEVSHFSFEKGAMLAGIDEIATDGNAFTFSYTDNATVFLAAPALEWVALYTVQGVEVAKVKADASGVATVDVSSLAPGVYVVAPNCHSALKIVKK